MYLDCHKFQENITKNKTCSMFIQNGREIQKSKFNKKISSKHVNPPSFILINSNLNNHNKPFKELVANNTLPIPKNQKMEM
jgi:hypothetical protein